MMGSFQAHTAPRGVTGGLAKEGRTEKGLTAKIVKEMLAIELVKDRPRSFPGKRHGW